MTQAHVKTKPIRLRLGKLLDVLVVSDPEQIEWLNAHMSVDRAIDPEASLVHRLVDRRLRGDLGFGGELLPVFLSRGAQGRAEQQRSLENRFETLRGLPGPEREQITAYVSGQKHVEEIGVTVQQWCGRLFFPHYRASRESYEAGRKIARWPTTLPLRAWKARVDGTLARAKDVVAGAAEHDRHCIHGTTIGMENVARSVRKLRKAVHTSDKQRLSPDEILRHCLTAPPAVLRGCTAEFEVPFLRRPLTPRTLIVFLVARAYAASGDLDIAFLTDGWSRCPAHEVIPEMLRAVWHAAHHDEPEHKRLLEKINGWSRLFSRAVS
jgi:hypothetical protein